MKIEDVLTQKTLVEIFNTFIRSPEETARVQELLTYYHRHIENIVSEATYGGDGCLPSVCAGFSMALHLMDLSIRTMPTISGTITRSDIDDALNTSMKALMKEAEKSGIPVSIAAPLAARFATMLSNRLGLAQAELSIEDMQRLWFNE